MLLLLLVLLVVAATDVVQESYCCHRKKKMKRNTNTLVHEMNEGKVATITKWSYRRQLQWQIEKESTCNCLRQFNTQVHVVVIRLHCFFFFIYFNIHETVHGYRSEITIVCPIQLDCLCLYVPCYKMSEPWSLHSDGTQLLWNRNEPTQASASLISKRFSLRRGHIHKQTHIP